MWTAIEDQRVDAAHLAEQSTYVREHGTHVHCSNCGACCEDLDNACAECGAPISAGLTVAEHYLRAHGVR